MLKGLHHVGVFVRDAEKSADFYERCFGFKPFYSVSVALPNPAEKLIFSRLDGLVLEFIQIRQESDLYGKTGIIHHVNIEVANIEDTFERMKAIGVDSFQGPIERYVEFFDGIKGVFLSGPDGEAVEITQYN